MEAIYFIAIMLSAIALLALEVPVAIQEKRP